MAKIGKDWGMNEKIAKNAPSSALAPPDLMAAEQPAAAGLNVTIYERMASPARKLLMAGRGGLNLTHSEDLAPFLARYGAAAEKLKPFLDAFGPQDVRDWCAGLEQETFVGTSGRVFPRALKASPLLRAWLRRLAGLGVQMQTRHEFRGFSDRAAVFDTPGGPVQVEADVFVLALGGASWPRLGADGGWVAPLKAAGVAPALCVRPIAACSSTGRSCFAANSKASLSRISGCISAIFRRTARRSSPAPAWRAARSDALSGAIRDLCLAHNGNAEITVDLRPDLAMSDLAQKLSRPREKQSTSTFLRKAAGLSPLAISLLHESGPLPATPDALAARIRRRRWRSRAWRGLERAISTAGGVLWDALDGNLMAKISLVCLSPGKCWIGRRRLAAIY